jgi:hypothetical protein
MAQSITNLEKVSNYFSLATYHYKNQRQLFANVLILQVFLVNKQWKMLPQVSNLSGQDIDQEAIENIFML